MTPKRRRSPSPRRRPFLHLPPNLGRNDTPEFKNGIPSLRPSPQTPREGGTTHVTQGTGAVGKVDPDYTRHHVKGLTSKRGLRGRVTFPRPVSCKSRFKATGTCRFPDDYERDLVTGGPLACSGCQGLMTTGGTYSTVGDPHGQKVQWRP